VASDLQDDLTETQTLDREIALAESIRLLGRTKDIDTLTELEGPQVRALCAIDMMAKEFDIPLLAEFGNNFVKFQVAYKRKGRKGIEDILRHNINMENSLMAQLKNKMGQWTQ